MCLSLFPNIKAINFHQKSELRSAPHPLVREQSNKGRLEAVRPSALAGPPLVERAELLSPFYSTAPRGPV